MRAAAVVEEVSATTCSGIAAMSASGDWDVVWWLAAAPGGG